MIPTPYVVAVQRLTFEGEDAHGNPVEQWSDPDPLFVHAIGPRVQEEPGDPRRWHVIDGRTVYAPAEARDRVTGDDRVLWPVTLTDDGRVDVTGAVEWAIDGDVADWTFGPWSNPVAGVSFDITTTRG